MPNTDLLFAGGEAEPQFPIFDSVLLVTGEIRKPKRILPVVGFDGVELWPSQVGVHQGVVDADHLPAQHTYGENQEVVFNWMSNIRHMEGGRVMFDKRKSPLKMPDPKPAHVKKSQKQALQVGPRIRQNLKELSEEDDSDPEYVPKSNIPVPQAKKSSRIRVANPPSNLELEDENGPDSFVESNTPVPPAKKRFRLAGGGGK